MLSLADGGLNRYCGEPNLDQMAPGKAMALLAAARARFVTVNASSQRSRHRENARADDTINDVRCQAPGPDGAQQARIALAHAQNVAWRPRRYFKKKKKKKNPIALTPAKSLSCSSIARDS